MDKLVEIEDHEGRPMFVRPSGVFGLFTSTHAKGCTDISRLGCDSMVTVKGSPREVHAKLFPEPT